MVMSNEVLAGYTYYPLGFVGQAGFIRKGTAYHQCWG